MSNEFETDNINPNNNEIEAEKELDNEPETQNQEGKERIEEKVEASIQEEESKVVLESESQLDSEFTKEDSLDKHQEEKLDYTFWAESAERLAQVPVEKLDNQNTEKELGFTQEISQKLNEHINRENGLEDNETSQSNIYEVNTENGCIDNNLDQSTINNNEGSSYRLKYADLINNQEIDREYYDKFNNDLNNEDTLSNEESLDLGKKQTKRGKKIVSFIATAAAFGVIAGLTFTGVNYLGNRLNNNNTTSVANESTLNITSKDDKNSTKIPTTTITSGVVNGANDVSNLVSQAMPSIVSINCRISETVSDFFGNNYEQEAEGSGSGIIVGKNDSELLVATNNHVVDGAKKIMVKFVDNKEVEAVVKGKDSTADLAVLAIKLSDINKETVGKIKVAVLGDSDKVKVGQMAVAIGNALGYGQSVTVGYISAKDRTVQVSTNQKLVLLQTDAAINPGNSGGALLNANGEVIGINSAKTAANEVEGMGYAIPISKATPIIDELVKREVITEAEQGYLGVTGADITDEDIQKFNLPAGVSIATVVKDGPADKAGLKHGDIITKVNGSEVTSFTQLKEKVNSNKIGTKLTIIYMRSDDGEYKEKEATVVLGKRPEQSQISGEATEPKSGSDSNGAYGGEQYPDQGSEGDTDNGLGGLDEFFNFGN